MPNSYRRRRTRYVGRFSLIWFLIGILTATLYFVMVEDARPELLLSVLPDSAIETESDQPSDQELINRAQKLDLMMMQADIMIATCPQGVRIFAEWREDMQNKYDVEVDSNNYATLEDTIKQRLSENADRQELWKRLDEIDSFVKRVERTCG